MIEGYSGDIKEEEEIVDTNVVEKEKVDDPANELSKILTGIDMRENPTELMSVMIRDRLQVFQKYGIQTPEEVKQRNEYDSYYTYILSFIGQNNIPLSYISKEELPSDVSPKVRAYVTKENTIAVVVGDIEGVDKKNIEENLTAPSLLHETIHVLQHRGGKNLPPERREYEAYVAANLVDHIFIANKLIPEGTSDEDRVKQISSVSTSFLMQNILGSSLASYSSEGVKLQEIPFMYK